MSDWDLLIDEADIASLLPEAYAHYRRPIKQALTVFLEGLPAVHQDAIVQDQAALPSAATLSERVARLARSCPALHKLGQTLARDRRLAPELRLQLQQLESLPPSIPLVDIADILMRELGPLDRLGVALEPPALAEASVAVVVPFRREQDEGVFKVLKPGIEDRLEQELALLERVGRTSTKSAKRSGFHASPTGRYSRASPSACGRRPSSMSSSGTSPSPTRPTRTTGASKSRRSFRSARRASPPWSAYTETR